MGIVYFSWTLVFVPSSCKERPSTSTVLKNSINEERVDEDFKLSRMELRAVGGELLPVMKKADGTYIPYQVGGTDQNGLWGELAFVYTLGGHETVELLLDWVSVAGYPIFERHTNICYRKMASLGQAEESSSDTHGEQSLLRSVDYPYQMDGLARGNDKVGFRRYFDDRNCHGLFGKRVSEMVLDTVGFRVDGYPDSTYQVLKEWGCDILSVTNFFGLGEIAIQLQSTLLQVGTEQKDTVGIIDSSHPEVVAEEPVRFVFRLDFTGWDVLGTKVNIHETVTIRVGRDGCEEEVRTSPFPENTVLITGFVGNNNTREFVEGQYAGKWASIITYDKQTASKNYELGMALLIPKNQLVGTFHAPDEGNGILGTWCVKLKPGSNGYCYQAYAGWELGVDDFSKREEFIRLVDTYADYLNRPTSIHVN